MGHTTSKHPITTTLNIKKESEKSQTTLGKALQESQKPETSTETMNNHLDISVDVSMRYPTN